MDLVCHWWAKKTCKVGLITDLHTEPLVVLLGVRRVRVAPVHQLLLPRLVAVQMKTAC